MKLYPKVLGVALGVVLTGAVGVLAQTSTQQSTPSARTEGQATTPNNQDGQGKMCPMMKGNGGQMNMSMMMDCCKKMGMNMERPATGGNSERKSDSKQ